jgi:hypothetical protein
MTKSILTFLLLPVTISVHRYVMIDQFKLLTCEHTWTKQSIVPTLREPLPFMRCLNNSDDAPPNSRASSGGVVGASAHALNASQLHLTSPLRTWHRRTSSNASPHVNYRPPAVHIPTMNHRMKIERKVSTFWREYENRNQILELKRNSFGANRCRSETVLSSEQTSVLCIHHA